MRDTFVELTSAHARLDEFDPCAANGIDEISNALFVGLDPANVYHGRELELQDLLEVELDVKIVINQVSFDVNGIVEDSATPQAPARLPSIP